MSDYEQSVFISYTRGGDCEEVVNQIDQALQTRGYSRLRLWADFPVCKSNSPT